VVLTEEDFAELPLASSRAIEVLSFADADTVDPVRLSRSYYCEPTGSGAKAYVLLREALQRTGKVALVKVALRTRETPAVLHPRDGVLVLHLLLWPDEVRTPRFRFLRDDNTPLSRELQAAEAYIHTLSGTLESPDLVDRYQAALRELVEAKVAGRQLEQPVLAHAGSADNLMEALRRSVEQAKHDRGNAAPARRPARKRPAKQATTKSVGAPQPTPARKATTTKRSPARKTAAKKSTEGH
jgi:DNA end-binding protein Ku